MPAPDDHLGTYRLIAPLGAGGMGEVWKAEDTRLGRLVAIKIVPESITGDAEAIARLRREARLAAQLNHPNIATIYAIEEEAGRLFIVMELVEGEPLGDVMRRGPIAESDLCRIARGVAEALAEAHAKGIVHRDIKPDNILVRGTRVKVLDFGIAKQVGVQTSSPNDPTAPLTQQGVIVGTVYYMSPEQALGKPVDARTDIFSLGVVLYAGATRRLPFRGETVTETLTQIIRDEAPPIDARLSPGMREIIARCMRKNRDERYDANGLAEALERQIESAITVLTGSHVVTVKEEAVRERRGPGPAAWWWMIAAALMVAAAAVGVMVYQRRAAAVVVPAPAPVVAAAPPSTASVAVVETTRTTTTGSLVPELPSAQGPPPAPGNLATREPAKPNNSPPPSPGNLGTREPGNLTNQSADDWYREAMVAFSNRDMRAARAALVRAVEADPSHAKAHFRLGELHLFARHFGAARGELSAALQHSEKLTERERLLCQLGLAVCDGDRVRARELADELQRISPGDPELFRYREAFAPGQPPPRRRPFRP